MFWYISCSKTREKQIVTLKPRSRAVVVLIYFLVQDKKQHIVTLKLRRRATIVWQYFLTQNEKQQIVTIALRSRAIVALILGSAEPNDSETDIAGSGMF